VSRLKKKNIFLVDFSNGNGRRMEENTVNPEIVLHPEIVLPFLGSL
jgi:hypothetical protein